MKITFVKKILLDGSACKKCLDVEKKLERSRHIEKIDHTAIVDERDPNSEGHALARLYGVDRAPFFIVEQGGQAAVVYTIYMKFLKEVLAQETKESDELKEIMANNQDLDFL